MKSIETNQALMVTPATTIREALKQIDSNGEGLLFVVDGGLKLIGAVTDGDIRRALLDGKSLIESIEETYNRVPFFFLEKDFSNETAKKVLVEKRFDVVPIVSSDKRIIGYVTWEELFSGEKPRSIGKTIDVPIVIMAGGKGTRLAPFTNVLPKPLIPIGDQTILEIIVESFRRFAAREYYFSINYRGEMIKAYFDGIERDYSVTYLRETDFWGTAGSLKLLPTNIGETFIVSNCDIIVNADYSEVLEFHRNSGSFLTVISSIQHHTVPYGVIKFEAGGNVTEIEEKPEFSFCINTGVYVLQRECLEYIPEQEVFHMTHLMERLMREGKKVSTYPVNESEYIDVGQWEEYHRAVSLLSK